MIQKGSYLKIVDNSGGNFVSCIYVGKGYRKRYARLGDTIKVSVKNLRSHRRKGSKLKKGDVVKAVIVRAKSFFVNHSTRSRLLFENSAILVSDNFKYLGSRVFGPTLNDFRYTSQVRLCSMAIATVK